MNEENTTWAEMKRLYPNQWLQIVEFEVDCFGEVTDGVVMGHGSSVRDLPSPPRDRGELALRFTGETTFSGLRRRTTTRFDTSRHHIHVKAQIGTQGRRV